MTRQILTLLLASATLTPLHAQTPKFSPLETFAPLTLPEPATAFRSASGAPGPLYWQNRADYILHATINPTTHTLTGSTTITYTNNSPDTLTSLWLNLEQNTYREDSRANAFYLQREVPRPREHTTGYTLDSVEIQTAVAKPTKALTIETDTRLQIQLANPLPHAAKITIKIHYHYTIPGEFGGRTSWATYKQGDIYDIAQWYPRMCVYDDLHGWDTQPYLANEFYLEYGHFDYFITVPSNFLVTGSGALINPTEVLTKLEQQRIAQAHASDATILIRTPEEAAAAAALHPSTTKTWHFAMSNTRDVTFAASPAFLWDAARINLPAHKSALAQSLYPIEATATPDAWQHSTAFVKDTVERMSARWFPYPWPNAISVAGPTSGMEYPGIVFDGPTMTGKTLFFVTAHEIGHTWFPMIVGSNERRDAWIDEGFNTFIDTFESDDFANGIYGPKRDGEYAPHGGFPADEIAAVIAAAVADREADGTPAAPTILTRADAIREKYRHPITYFKSAFGLTLLREDILGPARFDHAFRKFIADWAFKHPSPSDFFRTMESEGGEDLSYFWRGWYLNNWQLDMAITATDNTNLKELSITLTNRGQLVLPATVRVTFQDNTHTDLAIPAETWLQQTTHTFTLPTSPTNPAKAIILDPDHHLPLQNRPQTTTPK